MEFFSGRSFGQSTNLTNQNSFGVILRQRRSMRLKHSLKMRVSYFCCVCSISGRTPQTAQCNVFSLQMLTNFIKVTATVNIFRYISGKILIQMKEQRKYNDEVTYQKAATVHICCNTNFIPLESLSWLDLDFLLQLILLC